LYVMCSSPVRKMALGVEWLPNFISAGRWDSHFVSWACSVSRDIPFTVGSLGTYCVETIARTIPLSAGYLLSHRRNVHNRANLAISIGYGICSARCTPNTAWSSTLSSSLISFGSSMATSQSSSRILDGSPSAAELCWSRIYSSLATNL